MNNSLGETQGVVSAEQPIEGLGQQGGESLIAQLDSAVTQAEQLRNQQVHQQHNDQLGDLRPGEGRANRPAAIQPGCGVKLREGALAGHSTKSAWLDSRQKSARSMGAASCATNNADRAGCAALRQGGGGEEAAGV